MTTIYDKIKPFCETRNLGSVLFNSDEPTPRVLFLQGLLEEVGIDYELDRFSVRGTTCHNLILRGDSGRFVIAHHDIVNPKSDNANDNSASVINVIALKLLVPSVNVVLLDGEEFGGLGSKRLAQQILANKFGQVEWVLNLELSGIGGERFLIGNYPGPLFDRIRELFAPPVLDTPFNDSVPLRRSAIDSCVINPLPLKENATQGLAWKDEGFLDLSVLGRCHSVEDSLDKISTTDMQAFVERVLVPIVS